MNFDIKRKINTLRDILVGKVPDPKAQVEQITIALIYKFMDDMDLEGAEFGGERVFFTGEYEKYAFSQIMLPENSAQDRLNLYAEGIDKMTNNPDLPKLFRDILRNTYIPYRDPETLNRFLKEIAEFSYEDSEDLGNAFEYLLSIMGSQGDAGQFRTPRHIIDMMVEITAPQKNETILDPACGTAGFLISAYNYIKKCNVDEKGNSTLNADDQKRITANFAGYDISPDMVRLSRVNMYLHRFTTPNISEYDTLTSLEKWDDNYDVIFANPPFMTPKGGITPHNRYRVSAKRAEVLFVDYIAEHLNPTGRASIVVPEGIVFQSQTAYKNLRRFLVDDGYLYGVISLPAGVFNPYSGVKTSILLIDRTLAKAKDSILFVKLNNDGFDLGAQRREIKGSEIPDVINIFKDYQDGKDVADRENVVIAKKEDIAGQDYILVGERYVKTELVQSRWPQIKLGELCSFINGRAFKPSDWTTKEQGGLPIIRIQNLNDRDAEFNYFNGEYDTKYEVHNGELLFSWSGSRGSSFGAHIWNGSTAILNQHIFRVEFSSNLNKHYLYYALNQAVSTVEQRLHGGVGLVHITKGDLEAITIPVPPLTVQEEIVAEIESYQRIIDGARQVVENYKPTIKIDPAWEYVKLSDLCLEMRNGTNVEQIDSEGKYRVTRIQTISDGTVDLEKTKWTNDEPSEGYFMQAGDILLSHINSYEHLAKTAIFHNVEEKVVHGINLIRCRLNQERILPEYAIIYMKSEKFISDARKYAQRAVNQASIKTSDLRQLDIPTPSIEQQTEIVCKISEEVSIVEQNKRLIEIFQKKIKDKIAEVWGE